MTNELINELIKKLKEIDIISKEPVILKNAGESNFYIDIKKAYGYPEILNLISERLYQKINKHTTCIATAGYGGLPPSAIISAKYDLKLTLIRENPKEHGKRKLIDGYIPNKEDKITIIDDVFTTGGCLKEIIKNLKQTEAEILGCSVVVKRGEGDLLIPLDYLIEAKELF